LNASGCGGFRPGFSVGEAERNALATALLTVGEDSGSSGYSAFLCIENSMKGQDLTAMSRVIRAKTNIQ